MHCNKALIEHNKNLTNDIEKTMLIKQNNKFLERINELENELDRKVKLEDIKKEVVIPEELKEIFKRLNLLERAVF